jgi:asparagine synthase (glutamine-hydrolysing)
MCGIAGMSRRDRAPVDVEALGRMTAALVHRGPDEGGFHVEPGIGLGHRRLSIIDLHSGKQPLCNEDGTVWVSFNGEIFNYVELRAQLQAQGHVFKSRTDTEVLVHLYEERGLDFVQDLNGQFAIALWDARRRRLVLARDRVGIRPLFHATLPDGTLLFASEIKAILAHGAIAPEIDPVAVGQISRIWICVPPRTCFKGIDELGAGRMLVVEAGQRSEIRYWQHRFPREHEYQERTLDYWTGEVRGLLEDAVSLQLRSDVPVATYLSGGLDSSILTALTKTHHINDLMSFSVGFADARFDEQDYQRKMVAHLQTDHRQIEVDSAEIGRAFAEVIWYAERPMMRTAPAPLLRLSQLVRQSGIKVVLSGEGADEIFAGYNIFREDKVRRFWARHPASAWRGRLLNRLYGYVRRDARAEAFWLSFFKPGLENTDDPYYSHRIRWQNMAQVQRIYDKDFAAQMQSEEALLAELDAYLEPDRAQWHPLCRAQHLEMALFMSCYLLNSQGDRMMMGNSVEGRVPFLDHRLIELAARIPPKFKLRGIEEKYVLRRAAADLVPATVAARPKQPYRAPIAACFAPGNHNPGARLLRREELLAAGILNAPAIQRLMDKAAANSDASLSEREEMSIATAVSLQLFHQQFIANFGRAETRISA